MIDHPDLYLQQSQVKHITRGGTKAADDKAMDAYWQAMKEGKTLDEAGEVFIRTYIKSLKHGK